jgi:ferredoxin
MRIEIARTRCSATGFCAQLAPEVFQLAPEPPTRVIQENLKYQDKELYEEAAEMCPTRAILITDDGT